MVCGLTISGFLGCAVMNVCMCVLGLGWGGNVPGNSHTHMFRKSKVHLALSSFLLTLFLNPCVFQENLNLKTYPLLAKMLMLESLVEGCLNRMRYR